MAPLYSRQFFFNKDSQNDHFEQANQDDMDLVLFLKMNLIFANELVVKQEDVQNMCVKWVKVSVTFLESLITFC